MNQCDLMTHALLILHGIHHSPPRVDVHRRVEVQPDPPMKIAAADGGLCRCSGIPRRSQPPVKSRRPATSIALHYTRAAIFTFQRQHRRRHQ